MKGGYAIIPTMHSVEFTDVGFGKVANFPVSGGSFCVTLYLCQLLKRKNGQKSISVGGSER